MLGLAVVATMFAQAPKGWKMRVDRSASASDPDGAGDINSSPAVLDFTQPIRKRPSIGTPRILRQDPTR